ncbi:MAG: YfhO family protein [Acidobacteria bacterium]|nr:YfhO family protein [Acidobacteriota bacterium]
MDRRARLRGREEDQPARRSLGALDARPRFQSRARRGALASRRRRGARHRLREFARAPPRVARPGSRHPRRGRGARCRQDLAPARRARLRNYPGWRASVDGQEARVLQTNYSLRGVRVPAGDHAVEFTFAPRSSRLGALVSLCATLATALVALWLARGRRLGVDDQSS